MHRREAVRDPPGDAPGSRRLVGDSRPHHHRGREPVSETDRRGTERARSADVLHLGATQHIPSNIEQAPPALSAGISQLQISLFFRKSETTLEYLLRFPDDAAVFDLRFQFLQVV